MQALQDIQQTLDEVAEEICDKFCRCSNAPVPEGRTEDWLHLDEDSPCNTCPLNRL